jgi:hypothetical protein
MGGPHWAHPQKERSAVPGSTGYKQSAGVQTPSAPTNIIHGSEVFFHPFEGIKRRRENCVGKMEVPFELVEPGHQGVGQDEVVVDQLAVGAAAALGDASAEGPGGAGEDLAYTAGVLQADFIRPGAFAGGGERIAKAAALDDGEEAPAKLGLFLAGELDRDEAGGEGPVEHGRSQFRIDSVLESGIHCISLSCSVNL